MREAQGLRGAPLQSRARAVPDAPGRSEGGRRVRADLLGRGPGPDQGALGRDHRDPRCRGDHASRLSGSSGDAERPHRGRRLLQPARLQCRREDRPRIRLVHRLGDDRRPDRWVGRREPVLREVHHRVGHEHDQHQPARLAVHSQAKAKGAKVVVIDPVRTRTAKAADWHIAIRPGTDAALALGMMERDHRRGPGRPGLCRPVHAGLRGAEAARRRIPAGAGGRHHWHSGGGRPHPGAGVRHHPAVGDPPGRGARAQPRRRPGDPRDHLPAGAGGRLAPCRRRHRRDADLGVSDPVRPDLPARTGSSPVRA